MRMSYQAADLEWNHATKQPEARPQARVKFALATAAVAFFALVPFSSRRAFPLANFAKAPKVFSPEELAAAQAEAAETLRLAEIHRISGLPHSYLPALDYENPCDAVQRDCCTDSRFPVLGGMDLVHYRLTGQIAFGDPKYSAEIEGISRTYIFWFSDKSFIPVFQSNPEAYLPRFGGFNAGEFCNGGDFSTLLDKTVELQMASEVARHLAFTDSPISDVEICDNKFNSVYGKPTNGLFNTRCISMRNLEGVPGLLQQMPVVSIPVKMSQLYGVAPQLKSSDPSSEQVSTDSVAATPVLNQLDSGSLQPHLNDDFSPPPPPPVLNTLVNLPGLGDVQGPPPPPPRVPSSSQTSREDQGVIQIAEVVLPLHVPIDSIHDEITQSQIVPVTPVQAQAPFITAVPSEDQLQEVTEIPESALPLEVQDKDATFDSIQAKEGVSQNDLVTSTFSFLHQDGEGSQPKWTPPEVILSAATLPLKVPVNQGENTDQEQKHLGKNALTKRGIEPEMEFPNSEKPIGEKALLKRGLEDSSELSPGLLKQLLYGDELLGEGTTNSLPNF